jgi:hypothetical protein
VERNAMSYEALKDDPKFKAFCRPTIVKTAPRKTKFKVPIPKRKGVWSVLGPYTTGRLCKFKAETLFIKKVATGEFVSDEPWEGKSVAQGPYKWPPKDWKPEQAISVEGRWIKVLFPGKCAGCGAEVKQNDKAYYVKETRLLLCAAEGCGTRVSKGRWAA